MKNSNLALGACIVSYALTAVAYVAPTPTVLRYEVQAERADYRSIFSKFLRPERENQEKNRQQKIRKVETLVVVTDPTGDCEPCKKQKPILDKLVKEGYNVSTVTPREYRRNTPRKHRQRIEGIPTLLFLEDSGKAKWKVKGWQTEEYIKQYLKLPAPKPTGEQLE